ncbi:MAG TPA: crosslink repair DNA glycosylase YcaQ family protein [Thermoanaerobaculaceae bacterium]|nr:crosslink repair DNA glycosylase YcaQ family protein [Thermoanaerobaculaceae bacterium]HPS77542.1 crosslink repair DNA glycosylase YcaQ family protein [Thermoanaerobaculaceae bacterium]
MESLSIRAARRLALCRAGLLKPAWADFPAKAPAGERGSRRAAHEVIARFGYLQLDTVSVAGARSHAIVLLSRLQGFDPALAEELLQPGEPLFEYWGHEACWLPLELYPVFAFRRRELVRHPWWGDLLGEHPKVAEDLLRRVRDGGPLRSAEMEGQSGKGWWDLKVAKRVATALWSSGELAIRERAAFQRTYDLAERVIPESFRRAEVPQEEALERLLLLALGGHGWAATGTLAQTWRLRNRPAEIKAALARLRDQGAVLPCALVRDDDARLAGWVRPEDLDLAGRLESIRPRPDVGILLSPFDPVLWDRPRVKSLFGFDQVLEIFKPADKRTYGYYCMPVLAGEHIVARVDLKARRRAGTLDVLSCHLESAGGKESSRASEREAIRVALARYAQSLRLELVGPGPSGASKVPALA